MCHIFLKYAIHRRCCKKDDIWTKIVTSCLTKFAMAAGLSWFQSNLITNFQMFYIFSGAQALLGAFNLLPVKPLDGGQLLWLAVAYIKEPYTADRLCGIVSAAVSFGFMLLAVWLVRCGRGGTFLLLGALLLSYHAMGEKGLVKWRKNK